MTEASSMNIIKVMKHNCKSTCKNFATCDLAAKFKAAQKSKGDVTNSTTPSDGHAAKLENT